MKLIKLTFSIFLLLPCMSLAQLDGVSYDWKEIKNSKGIVISTSKVDGSPFKAVRGEMIVKASVASLFALIEDMSACSDWAAMCKEAKLVERLSASESYVYIYNNIPFPVKDRDVYTHVVWTLDAITKGLSMTSIASDGGTPKTKAVRIEDAVSQWHFTPNSDGTTTVENFAHIDPNGPTPAWLTNMMLVSAPFNTMIKMRKIVESGAYSDATIPTDLQ